MRKTKNTQGLVHPKTVCGIWVNRVNPVNPVKKCVYLPILRLVSALVFLFLLGRFHS